MKIRLANKRDIKTLARLIPTIIEETAYYSDEARREESKKYNLKTIREYLTDSKYYLCFVATEKRKTVGFILGRNEAGVFWVDWAGVVSAYRRQGIAESLVKNMEGHLLKRGVHKIWSDTRNTNKQSIALLNKLKYKKLGLFKNGWYKQDFFLWEKDLEEPKIRRASSQA